jgi:molybdopterin/thiamine biosynthesis adenylyltransferase
VTTGPTGIHVPEEGGASAPPFSRADAQPFDYATAFSRNLGWTTEWEQQALRARRVAIAGLGGVGGFHLLALARLGIGAFHIADLDRFGIENMNRQAGATMATLGRPKVDVLAEMALSINPTLDVERFERGVTLDNIDRFLAGCDLFVDGFDFFALGIRAAVFARCAELGIPAVTAAPIGMGVGFLAFLPGRMTFEQYFRLAGQPEQEQYLRFLMGVAPAGLHRAYLVDDTRVDLAGKRGPSTVAACELCAGMVATQALKLLLGRGGVPHAPTHVHFDAYRTRLALTRLPWGNAGPLQRLKLAIARKIYSGMARRAAAPPPVAPASRLLAVLDLARWAPSGDNTQPWRFELLGERRLRIHLAAPDPANPYEYRGGAPILLSGGMLLESLRVAARAEGWALDWQVEPGGPPWHILAELPDASDEPGSTPAAALLTRSVARTALGTARLTVAQKARLAESLGPDLEVVWHESRTERLHMARLGAIATDIRLRAPETFQVHRRVVDWHHPRSPTGLPSGAIGLDRPTLAVMRWAVRDWQRMQRLNKVAGTWGAQLQLDIRPALASAAFFVIRTRAPDDTAPAQLRHGMALQRFWLAAEAMGLGMQPALATLIFAHHGRHATAFTVDVQLRTHAARLAARLEQVAGDIDALVFLGRLGQRRPGLPGPRSVRRPLEELLLPAGVAKVP